MHPPVVLAFTAKHYGRAGFRQVILTFDDWEAAVANWVWPALQALERRCKASPPNITMWDELKVAIPALGKVRSWAQFTSIPVSDLEVLQVRDVFIDIDDTFHQLWGSGGASKSSRVRTFILDYLMVIRRDGKLGRVAGSFAPKRGRPKNPRKLISDQVVMRDGRAHAPVSALPHTTPEKLKAETHKRLQDDLDVIAQACLRELDEFESACAALERLASRSRDEAAEMSAAEKLKDRESTVVRNCELLSEVERVALITCYLHQDRQLGKFETPDYEGSKALARQLSSEMGIEADRFIRCSRYRYFPNHTVLVAAMLLIQIETAWNIRATLK